MLQAIQSTKYQEVITFYTEDIEWNGSQGTMTAPGVGDCTGREYDVILSKDGSRIRDFRLHNT